MPIAFHPTQDPISSTDGTTHGLGCGSSGGQASIAVAHEMTIPIDSMNHLGRTNENHSMGDFVPGAPSYTLTKAHSHAVAHPIVLMDQGGGVMNVQTDGTVGTLRRETHGHEPVIVQPTVFNIAPGKGELKDDIHVTDAHISKTIDASGSNPAMHQGGAAIVQPMSFDTYNLQAGNISQTLQSRTNNEAIGTVLAQRIDPIRYGEHQQDTLHHESGIMSTLPAGSNDNTGHYTNTVIAMAVRRLTPMECERLQGFPDGYTNIPWRKADESPDGPRYKALGNSWAVPVVAWIGKRIDAAIKEKSNG